VNPEDRRLCDDDRTNGNRSITASSINTLKNGRLRTARLGSIVIGPTCSIGGCAHPNKLFEIVDYLEFQLAAKAGSCVILHYPSISPRWLGARR
jgi:hypothetical protein